jgi:hypothetical protein
MSYMLIRVLQSFSSISLDVDAQPPETRVPASWAKVPGRQSTERFWPKAHLTMHARVRHFHLSLLLPKLTPKYFDQGGLWVKMKEADHA